MPQLDAHHYLSLTLYSIVSLILIYLTVSRRFCDKIQKAIFLRNQTINNYLLNTKLLNEQSNKTLQQICEVETLTKSRIRKMILDYENRIKTQKNLMKIKFLTMSRDIEKRDKYNMNEFLHNSKDIIHVYLQKNQTEKLIRKYLAE